jgi:hypothetical protein
VSLGENVGVAHWTYPLCTRSGLTHNWTKMHSHCIGHHSVPGGYACYIQYQYENINNYYGCATLRYNGTTPGPRCYSQSGCV